MRKAIQEGHDHGSCAGVVHAEAAGAVIQAYCDPSLRGPGDSIYIIRSRSHVREFRNRYRCRSSGRAPQERHTHRARACLANAKTARAIVQAYRDVVLRRPADRFIVPCSGRHIGERRIACRLR